MSAPDHVAVGIARAVAWPVAILLIVLSLLMVFKDKVVPTDFEASSTGIKIVFNLWAAAEHRAAKGEGGEPTQPDLRNIQAAVREAGTLSLKGSKVLWVDDQPELQQYERAALQQLGIELTLAVSTNEALPLLKENQFQLVITDFKRKDDPQAGYTLLSELRKISASTPLIIYSASSNPEFVAEATARGAYAETNQPEILFNEAIDAIKMSLGHPAKSYQSTGVLFVRIAYGLLLVFAVGAAIYSFTAGAKSADATKKWILLAWLVGPPIFFFLEYYVRHDGLASVDLEKMKDLQHLGSQVWAGIAAALATIYFKGENKEAAAKPKNEAGEAVTVANRLQTDPASPRASAPT